MLTKDSFTLPRLMWVKKQLTMHELHLQIFSFFRHIISEWVDWKDPKTEKKPKSEKHTDLRKELIEFAYQPNMTKQEFDQLTDQMAFNMCFPGLISDREAFEKNETWSVKDAPYKLEIKDISGYMEDCPFC